MKIRTDFVTNSSSNSFTLLVSIELKEGGVDEAIDKIKSFALN